MKKSTFCFFILILFLAGCRDQAEVTDDPADSTETERREFISPEPVSEEAAESLDVQNYFPTQPGTIRQYQSYNEAGEVIRKDYEVISSFGSTAFLSPEELGEFVIIRSSEIYEPDLSVKESNDFYELKNNELTHLAEKTAVDDESVQREIKLTNKPSWEVKPGITRVITATDKTIETKGGEFVNCIETTDFSKGDEHYLLQSYYAPEAGLVLQQEWSEESGNYMISKEMTTMQLPEENTPEENPETENESSPPTGEATGTEAFLYHNELHDFYLDLPAEWEDHYLVEETENADEKTINFRFKSGDNLYIDTIVQIIVTDKTKEQIEQENAESGFPLTYIASHNGESYAYLYNVGDPSIELINSEEDLNLLIELKQQVPTVMESLRFHP